MNERELIAQIQEKWPSNGIQFNVAVMKPHLRFYSLTKQIAIWFIETLPTFTDINRVFEEAQTLQWERSLKTFIAIIYPNKFEKKVYESVRTAARVSNILLFPIETDKKRIVGALHEKLQQYLTSKEN